MVNCRKVCHLLSAYMDGELPGVEHRQIREHVTRCAECANEYESLVRMKRLVSGLRLMEPPREMAVRMVAVLDGHTAKRTSAGSHTVRELGGWAIRNGLKPRVAGFALVLVALGLFLAADTTRGPQIDWQYVDRPVGTQPPSVESPAFIVPPVRPSYVSSQSNPEPGYPGYQPYQLLTAATRKSHRPAVPGAWIRGGVDPFLAGFYQSR